MNCNSSSRVWHLCVLFLMSSYAWDEDTLSPKRVWEVGRGGGGAGRDGSGRTGGGEKWN